MTIAKIITKYLQTNRRLVLPQLGAFIVKSPGEVIFSEMLKRDDGVLRKLLADEGMSELEAAGIIDRFVFELRQGVEGGAVFQAPGLGVFTRDNGIISFRFYPQLGDEPKEQPAQPETTEVQPPQPEPVATQVEQPSQPLQPEQPESIVAQPSQPEQPLQPEQPAQPLQSPLTGQDAPASVTETIDSDSASRKIKSILGEHSSQGGSSSHPRHADPSIKGLKYGSEKASEGFSYSSRSRRPDTFIILAIAAVILAVGAMVYAYLREKKNQNLEQEYVEQMVSSMEQQHSAGDPDAAAFADTQIDM